MKENCQTTMVAEVPVIILLEKLQKLQGGDQRVRPPELRAEVVTAGVRPPVGPPELRAEVVRPQELRAEVVTARVGPPELRTEVVTAVNELRRIFSAVNELRRIFSFLTKEKQVNITGNLKGLLDSIYSLDNTTERVLTTVQGRRKGDTEKKILQEFMTSFRNVSAEFNKIRASLHDQPNVLLDLPNENVDPITHFSEQEGFQCDQELYVLTGREEAEKELVQRLIEDDEKSLRAISLVSEEVLGKTALARTVYNKLVIRKHFQCRAWVHIPKDLRFKDLLIIILRTIPDCVLKGIELLDESELITMLVKSLMEHRFLIVLDNVFEVDIWHKLARSFADARNGSRVILTTRLSNVARNADPWSSPKKLEPLTSEKCWEFFLKKLGREDKSVLKFKDDILRVCEGSPAAILLLVGLLSTTQLPEWAEVINQLTLLNIVDLSYHNLPCVLKPCFLYLATFPKAYEIPTRRLLHLWLAEGFIVPKLPEPSDVNLAKKYFNALVRRNMIELQRWKPDGTPKTCLMPCYLYDVFLPKAEDIGFLRVQDGKSDVRTQTCTSIWQRF